MIHLTAFVPGSQVQELCRMLSSTDGVSHVIAGSTTEEGLVNVLAYIDADAADEVIAVLGDLDLPWEDVTFSRIPSIRPLGWQLGNRAEDPDSQVWAEVVSRADDNSQIAASYVLFMIAAGVVAGVGVLTGSSILVVGAMALSPDLLPISASAIGFVDRRPRLAALAIRVLAFGLAIATLAAFGATALIRVVGRVPDDLGPLADTALGPSLTELGPGSVLVALAAGMAGMIAYERAAGAAVGVAISVTTIPAAAYVGVAGALGSDDPIWGALVVLVVNVVLIIAAGTATLWVQRYHKRARGERITVKVDA